MLTVYLDATELHMNFGINAFMMTVTLYFADMCSLTGHCSNLALHFYEVGAI